MPARTARSDHALQQLFVRDAHTVACNVTDGLSTQIEDEFEVLVDDVGDWSQEQFGDQPSRYPLLGATEEAGELSTSVLKKAQGIDDDEKYEDRDTVGEAAEADALGDIVVYLADFVSRSIKSISTPDSMDEVAVQQSFADDVTAVLALQAKLGSLSDAYVTFEAPRVITQRVRETLAMLEAVADELGFDLVDCVRGAWYDDVSDRAWDATV